MRVIERTRLRMRAQIYASHRIALSDDHACADAEWLPRRRAEAWFRTGVGVRRVAATTIHRPCVIQRMSSESESLAPSSTCRRAARLHTRDANEPAKGNDMRTHRQHVGHSVSRVVATPKHPNIQLHCDNQSGVPSCLSVSFVNDKPLIPRAQQRRIAGRAGNEDQFAIESKK